MKNYFYLHFKMVNRKFSELGLEPFFGYLLMGAAFIGFSIFLFEQTEFSNFIYLLLAIFFIGKLSEDKRNEFLKLCFGQPQFSKIRMVENLLVSLPFLLFLMYKQEITFSLILILLSFLFAIVQLKTSTNLVIPTPFSKEPFEFCTGFRTTFFIYPIAYGLTIIAIAVGNFNLGIFAMLLCFAIGLMYYSKPEKEYFVWSFNRTPTEFLYMKIKTGIKFSTILVSPIFIALAIYDFHQITLLILFLIIGIAFICYGIIVKYANYPDQTQLIQAVFLMLSILFPPLLLIFIPYLFAKSKTRLSSFLK